MKNLTDKLRVPIISNATDENDDDSDDFIAMVTEIFVPTAIGLIILIVLGVGGNIMTMLAYVENRHHNKVYDFYIFNLAVTDLILCSVSMPLYTVYTLMNFTWPFGYWFCKIWLLIDFTACTEATALILILSMDRLLMISLRTKYENQITWKVAKTVLIISWIISLIYYGPAILAWNYLVGYSTAEYMDCDVEFVYENDFVITMSILDFLLPAVSLAVINGCLLIKIFSWTDRKGKSHKCQEANTRQCFSVSEHALSTQCYVSTSLHQNKASANISMPMLRDERSSFHSDNCLKSKKIGALAKENIKHTAAKPKLKSAKLLAMLVFSFLFFWSPYTITTVVISFCNKCVNQSLYEFFNWLLWMKSAVNPFLYAYNIPRYRQCFKKYMKMLGKCRNSH
ncbi:histamine H3 receptor-like [Ruditapes philippinarum]|uniref:histamine H3 receptor-like n=1 Tax=Ruditapes philippinarum TaxID=129788 RepID=UPI00295AD38D|nr:histamine H3 receptor-like [Ruditapes philippinarum]